MESLVDNIFDFVRIRQLNIAVAVILTGVYLIYQYWDVLTKTEEIDCRRTRLSRSRSRSGARSRSRSRSYYNKHLSDSKHRRGKKPHRRCPNCSLCDFEHDQEKQ